MSSKKKIVPPPVLPCTGVESHAHLNDEAYANDLEEVVERAAHAGVAHIGQVFLSPEAYRAGIPRFSQYPQIFFLLGIHPTEAFLYSSEVGQEIVSLIKEDARIRCIGEIGLDYYWKEVRPELQREVFTAQLELALQCDYPVAIHSRDAFDDTFTLLEQCGFVGRPLLWHCFGGDAVMAQTLIDAGWHISIPGPVTFPANKALREALPVIPLDRLLVETDCPYLSPVPYRGKRNEPAYLGYTIQAMADAIGMDAAVLWTICGDNARRFFSLETTSKRK